MARTNENDSRLIVWSANRDLHGRKALLELGKQPGASSESSHQPHGLTGMKTCGTNQHVDEPTLIMPWDATT
jgi:hypothetical protein